MHGEVTFERLRGKGVVGVLAAVLVTVGVLLAVAGLVDTNPVPDQAVVVGDGAAPVAIAPSHDRAEQGATIEDLAVREPATVSTATVPMRVRVKRRLGDTTTHYTGPLVVEVAGRVLTSTTLVNREALALEVPANATSLRFVAPDHVGLEESLPLRKSKEGYVVELAPDATLAVRSLGLPSGADGLVKITVDNVSGWSSHPRQVREDAAAFEAPFAVGEEFRWSAELSCGTRWVSLDGREAALRPGERRVLTFDFASVPMQRYRVVGPSPELMAELLVGRRARDGTYEPSWCRLDSTGSFEVSRVGGCPWWVHVASGEVELAEEQQEEAILLRPPGPLVALGVRAGSAEPQQTLAFSASGETVSARASLHVFARDRLPAILRLGARFASSVEVHRDRLPSDDVVWLEPAAAAAPGRCLMHLRGDPPAVDVEPKLRVEAYADGEVLGQQAAIDGMQFELPPDVSFSVRWRLANRHGPWIAQDLHVASGATRELTAEWPTAHRWTGEVEGFALIPPELRWHRVSWGNGPGLFGRGMERLKDDGCFDLFLFVEETLDPTWSVFWGLTPVSAQIEVTAARRHFVLRPLGEVRWVRVDVDAPPPWTVFVWGSRQPRLLPGSWHNEQRPIPVLAGEIRHGVLLRGTEVLAWFRIEAQGDTVQVRPAEGHTIELRPRAARKNRMVCLVGPGGQWDMGLDLSSGSPQHLFAPEGTRGIVVFDGNQPDGPVREIPLGTDDVIVIE